MENWDLDNQNPNSRSQYEEEAQPSVEELRRTRKARVTARKRARKAKKRAKKKAAIAAGKKPRRKVNKLTLIILLVAGVAIFASARNILKLQSENESLRKKNEKLTETRNELKEELKNVNSREYIEKRAREQLRLVNPDEIIFVFPDDKDNEDEE